MPLYPPQYGREWCAFGCEGRNKIYSHDCVQKLTWIASPTTETQETQVGSAEAAPTETQGAGASPTKDLKVLIGNFISNFIFEMPFVHLYFLPQTPVGVFYHLLAINSTKVVLF